MAFLRHIDEGPDGDYYFAVLLDWADWLAARGHHRHRAAAVRYLARHRLEPGLVACGPSPDLYCWKPTRPGDPAGAERVPKHLYLSLVARCDWARESGYDRHLAVGAKSTCAAELVNLLTELIGFQADAGELLALDDGHATR